MTSSDKLTVSVTDFPLYRGKFSVIIASTPDEFTIEQIYPALTETYRFAHFVQHGHKGLMYYTIVLNVAGGSKVTDGTIAHEALHTVGQLMRDRGLKLTEDSEEAYCYLIEWVVDYVHKAIDKHKKS